jgi:hypothetical protein
MAIDTGREGAFPEPPKRDDAPGTTTGTTPGTTTLGTTEGTTEGTTTGDGHAPRVRSQDSPGRRRA